MTAGIGRTVLANCMPAKSLNDCGNLLRETRQQTPRLAGRKPLAANHASGAYAILGAVKREIAPTAPSRYSRGTFRLPFAQAGTVRSNAIES